jgi:hypothetical protein
LFTSASIGVIPRLWRRTDTPDLYGLSWSEHGIFAWEESDIGARVVELSDQGEDQVFADPGYFSQFWIEPDRSWFVAELRTAPGSAVEFLVSNGGTTWHLHPEGKRLLGPSMDRQHAAVVFEDHDQGRVVALSLDGRTSTVLRGAETGPFRLSTDNVAAYVSATDVPNGVIILPATSHSGES